ncbi:thioesterase family protein [Cellulomonas fimi]|uniref:acyl-CoA thioesterase n=1 Tax=Cellulomonas fimi TaxID=1708 RepID=UPI00234CF591|nr:acyl-CoA thioesterase [Cellulomonas fimi]MDC7122516.1 thioesterase family protein [Cellulomonas fimi]
MTRTIQLAYATFRPRPAIPGQTLFSPSVTTMRVHPGDLDLYRHVNNGVYLQMMDVARANFIADLGGYRLLAEHGWYPVVAASTVKYRRSLTLGQRFTITTRVLGWDERVCYLEQSFARGDQHIARGVVAGRFLARDGRRIPAPDVVELLAGEHVEAPELPDDVAAWAAAVDVAHRA